MIYVRIDKYLKVTRLIKRRTIAKEVIEDDVIFINGKVAKPSSQIKVNDILELHLGRRKIVVKVVQIEENATKAQTKDLYEIISDETITQS